MTTPGSAPDRRTFLRAAGALAGGAALGTPAPARAADDAADKAVAALYESLTAAQRKVMCFDWDKKGGYGGLLVIGIEFRLFRRVGDVRRLE